MANEVCPMPKAFSFDMLRKAYGLYEKYKEDHPLKQVPTDIFKTEFGCSSAYALALKNASEFKYSMKCKGLA